MFDSGQLLDEWHALVDSRAHFDDINLSIHHTTQPDVAKAPDDAAMMLLGRLARVTRKTMLPVVAD